MWKEPNDQGEEVVVLDFDGTDPQSDRSINFALSHEMLKMFVVFYLLTVFVSIHSQLFLSSINVN
jgi:5-oxoprolinase (ATP-hydrolysing)